MFINVDRNKYMYLLIILISQTILIYKKQVYTIIETWFYLKNMLSQNKCRQDSDLL